MMKKTFIIAVFCLAGWISVNNPWTDSYTAHLKSEVIPVLKQGDPFISSHFKKCSKI